MYLKLQILFAILSAVCVAVAIPVGVGAGLMGVLVCAGLAFICYLIMLTFKLKNTALNPTEESSGESVVEKKEESGEVVSGSNEEEEK